MTARDIIRTAALPPDWLQKAWAAAKERGLGALMLEEINAEISAVRNDRAPTRVK